MRPNRFLTAVLCLSLAVPPAALAQTGAASAASGSSPVSASPLRFASAAAPGTAAAQSGTLAASALRGTQGASGGAVPGNVAEGVFGVYGGAQSRFENRPGEMSGLRAPLSVVQLPDLGDGSGGSLTPQAERRLGERMMREVRADPDYLDDWLMRDYLNAVSSKLASAAVTQYLGGYVPDFDLFAVRDSQINAFSMPGGFIGVNTGLIATTQTESELASVIGHEMGHVLQRHIARMIGTQERSGYAALAGMLAGLLAGLLAKSGDLGMGIAMGGQAFAVDNQLRFSRAAEQEADRVGFQMLAAAGYDPYAMTTFFDRLDRSTMADNGVPPYARTHPLTGERIADMEDRARRVPYRQPRQTSEYAFVRARARVLQRNFASDYREIASRLQSEIGDQTALNVAANWYGIALAQTLLGDYGAANDALAKSRRIFEGDEASAAVASVQAGQSAPTMQLAAADKGALARKSQKSAASAVQRAQGASAAHAPVSVQELAAQSRIAAEAGLVARAPSAASSLPPVVATSSRVRSSPSLDVLAAEIARRAGRSDDAIRLADLAQQRWPESHAAVEVHLQALIGAHRYAEAQALAKRETRMEPARPDWWLFLAQASAGLNDPLQQHQAMAEKFALDGAWPSAIRQLKEARDVKGVSFYELSAISARLHDFETRYKEERDQDKNG
jgi:predicted Zn-dependent protease